MKKILNKQIALLLVAIIVLIILGSIFSWLVYSMNQKASKVLSAKEQLASYEESKKVFTKELEELKAISQNVDKFESYIITPNKTPNFLSQLEKLASEKKVDFTLTEVQTPDAATPAERLIIGFSAIGTNKSIEDFLYAIKHQTYQVQILSVSLSKTSQPQPKVDTEMKFVPNPGIEYWELFVSMQIMSY